jgi:hypothetical protein
MFDIADYLNPADPFAQTTPLDALRQGYLFKHRVAQLLQPRAILEIGVRYGYSAAAFLAACPTAAYLGLDGETASDGGVAGSNAWAEAMLRRHYPHARVTILKLDTQRQPLQGGEADLAHVDGCHTEEGCLHDLRAVRAAWVLVDDVEFLPAVARAVGRFVRGKEHVYFPSFRGDCLVHLPQPQRTPEREGDRS